MRYVRGMHAPDAVGRAASAGPAAPVRAEAPPGPAVRPSVRAVARRTEDLVNALTRDDPLPAPEGIAGLLREHGEVEPVVVTVEDVARMREAALALRAVFAAEGLDAAVAELNGLLAHGSGPLRLTAHGGSGPWHPHLDTSDDAPWGEWFLASSCLCLAVLVWERQRPPGGVCAAPGCGRVYLSLGSGVPRRYCSRRCATRERVAAHRRARAGGGR
ncbi:CGNR zinc finger [Streptomyces rubrolavendulae]|uniref:CGNR zinc finger n=3 Tax=Streptomyces TaxID=1883 RepID=A0A1D8FY01_9ACTN|nr:CGNR zinc finger [Streptomyces rubrolavendulae]OSY52688.1 CGNR zinc finger [Streptomyces fradiae ATCC 10745 = DSM 40063]